VSREAILAATERRSAALVARDAEALRALHHPDLRFTTPRGDVKDLEAYIAGNTQGERVWLGQRFLEVDVVIAGDTAIVTGVVRDEYEHAGEAATHDVQVTFTWISDDAHGWRVLAGHAGPMRT
jgi:ketosteroid isomerase-like protein